MKVLNRIPQLRAKFGYSQSDLADIVGLSNLSIKLIEKNILVPSLDIAIRLMFVFECSFRDIFYTDNDDEVL